MVFYRLVGCNDWRPLGNFANSGVGGNGGKLSTTESFCAALSKTFDGKHPCKLCKLVKEGKKSESKSEAQLI